MPRIESSSPSQRVLVCALSRARTRNARECGALATRRGVSVSRMRERDRSAPFAPGNLCRLPQGRSNNGNPRKVVAICPGKIGAARNREAPASLRRVRHRHVNALAAGRPPSFGGGRLHLRAQPWERQRAMTRSIIMRAADATARSRRTASTASSGLGLCGARAENTKGGRSQAKQSKAKQSRSVIQVPWRKKLSTRLSAVSTHETDWAG
jgi:hypothetical protein